MHQAREISPGAFPLPDGHLQGVQGQVGVQAGGGLPADDPPGVHVGDEGDVDPPGERTHVGDVGDPQLVRPERVDMPFDEVGRALVLWSRARRSGRLGASDTVQTRNPHEAHGRCTGPRDRHRDARQSRVGLASRASCGPLASSSWFLRTLGVSALRVSSRNDLADGAGLGWVSHVLGAILIPDSVRTRQIGSTPYSSFLVSMYWQISGTGAHTPPR